MSDSAGALASVIDVAMPTAPDSGSTTAIETPTITETPTETHEAPAAEVDTAGKDTDSTKTPDTSGKTEETKGSISSPTPSQVHAALQAFKDLDPEKNGAMAKQINGTLQRHYAMLKEIPGGVVEAREIATTLKEIAGEGGNWRDGLKTLQSTVANAKVIDQQLYEGSPDVITAIVEDLTTQGKLDALGKLLGPMAESCRENDPQGFVNHQRSLFLSTASDCGLVDSLNSLHDQLAEGKTADALKTLKNIGSYFSDLQRQESDKEKEAAVVKRERGQLDSQKSEQQQKVTQEFQSSVAKEARSGDAKSLGVHLGPILKMPFFKGYGRDNLQGLGQAIQQAMWQTCKDDKPYQDKMAALWKAGDRKAILSFHKSFVDSKAKDVVTKTTAQMYPGYSKASAAAGKVAAKNSIAVPAAVKQGTKATAPSATMVAVKPEWNDIDWSKDEKQHLYITGKAYLKKTGQLVAWRR
jgi:hypothetical protein